MNCKHIGFIEEIGVAKTYPPNGQSLMEYYLRVLYFSINKSTHSRT